MESDQIVEQASGLAQQAQEVATSAAELSQQVEAHVAAAAQAVVDTGHGDFFLTGLTVFVLACFVGYYVVWRVTPALHSPLMSVTNAISSVIIVGALIAAGPTVIGFGSIMGFLAVILASINIFGGFIVTQRMLAMYKKKQR
ncbi:MAG: NAD(P) transhydrogenase subunit alpha [Pseudomonadota bacterium]